MSLGFLVVLLIILLGSATVSLYFGYKADGEINVAEQMKKSTGGLTINGERIDSIPVMSPGHDLPNAGFEAAPSEDKTLENQRKQQATEQNNASSTDETASSTEAVSDETEEEGGVPENAEAAAESSGEDSADTDTADSEETTS